MADVARPMPQATSVPARTPWSLPRIAELPKLTALTLASAIGGTGGTGGSGSTVFTLLLAVLSLALLPACSADQSMEPSAPPMPKVVAAVTCRAEVAAHKVECGGPVAAPGQVIVGGQNIRVALTSSAVSYNVAGPEIFQFDVTVQNLVPLTLGWNGTTTTGVKIFFLSPPVATVGSGTITVVNGELPAFFTAANQDYFLYNQNLGQYEVSAPLTWQLNVPATVDFFDFTVLVAADVEAVGDPLRWTEVNGVNHQVVLGVARNSNIDAMAVGGHGNSWHFEVATWQRVTVTSDIDFADVAATGGGSYVAATTTGQVVIWNGAKWVGTGCNSTSWLFDISAIDATHWIAVGAHESVVNDGGSCSHHTFTLGGGSFLKYADAGPDGEYLAATQDGTYFLSADGNFWSPNIPFFPADTFTRNLTGAFLDQDHNIIWSFNSSSFGGGFYGAVMRNTDSLYSTVGQFPDAITPMAPDARDSLLVAYSAGSAAWLWKGVYVGGPNDGQVAPSLTTGEVFTRLSVGLNPGLDWFAVSNQQDLFLADVTSVFPQSAGATFTASLWSYADTTFMVNGDGVLYRVTPSGLNAESTPIPVHGIAGRGAGAEPDLWAVSDQYLYSRTAGTAWTQEWDNAGTNNFTAIAVSPDAYLWVATETGGKFITSTGTGTFEIDVGAVEDLNAVWILPGPITSTAYIASAAGNLWVWDGNSLQLDPTFPGAGLGPLYAVSGTSANDIWVGGSGGRLYHWNGGGWTDLAALNIPPFDVHSLLSISDGEVFAGMPQGWFVHNSILNPNVGVFQVLPGVPNGNTITAMTRLPNKSVLVAGGSFLFRGTQ